MDRKVTYARALATALSADIAASPTIARVIARDEVSQQGFTNIVLRDIAKGLSGDPALALFPNVRRFVQQEIDIATVRRGRQHPSGLGVVSMPSSGGGTTFGIDNAVVGGLSSVAGALAGAVGAIWGAKITTSAQKTLANIQLQEAGIVQTSQDLAVKAALIQNATAAGVQVNMKNGQVLDSRTGQPVSDEGITATASPVTISTPGSPLGPIQVGPAASPANAPGLPKWSIAAGAAALVVGGAFALSGSHGR